MDGFLDGPVLCHRGRAERAEGGVQRDESDAHVRRVDGDAPRAPSENGVHPGVSADRGATGSGRSFVARAGGITEVRATRALHKVPAHGGHVPQLRRRAREKRFREDRVPLGDLGVVVYEWQDNGPVVH